MKEIKYLQSQDLVSCCNEITRQEADDYVTNIQKKSVNEYICFVRSNDFIETATDQLLYIPSLNVWFNAQDILTLPDIQQLFRRDYGIDHIYKMHEQKDMHVLSVNPFHNFYIGNSNVLAHNMT